MALRNAPPAAAVTVAGDDFFWQQDRAEFLERRQRLQVQEGDRAAW